MKDVQEVLGTTRSCLKIFWRVLRTSRIGWNDYGSQSGVIPYYPRKKIKLPDNIHDFVDVSEKTLERLLGSNEPPDEEQHDYAFEGV